MPGFNRTGPMGAGPATGGGRGFCRPAQGGAGRIPFFGRQAARGQGYGFGRGFGRGFRAGAGPYAYPDYSPAPGDEIEMLRAEADQLRRDLNDINRRMAELQKAAPKSPSTDRD